MSDVPSADVPSPEPWGALREATVMVQANLATYCQELVELNQIGILPPDGLVRQLAAKLRSVEPIKNILLAQSIVQNAAVARVASL